MNNLSPETSWLWDSRPTNLFQYDHRPIRLGDLVERLLMNGAGDGLDLPLGRVEGFDKAYVRGLVKTGLQDLDPVPGH